MKIDPHCQQRYSCALKVLLSDLKITLIFLGIPLLRVYNQNTVNENDDVQPPYVNKCLLLTVWLWRMHVS